MRYGEDWIEVPGLMGPVALLASEIAMIRCSHQDPLRALIVMKSGVELVVDQRPVELIRRVIAFTTGVQRGPTINGDAHHV
jgi:hypothetical protein